MLPLLTGCGSGTFATISTGTMHLSGSIHAGRQPVGNASLQLYNVSLISGFGAAIPLLPVPVNSDANGAFLLTGDFVCAHAGDQLLLVAQGGNPGLAPGTHNPYLVMVTAVGRCGDLPTTPFVGVTEITTAAAAWALAPMLTSATNVVASPTNTSGLRNAFLNARLLSDIATGLLPTPTTGVTIEGDKVLALANSLASCSSSAGGNACLPLLNAATPSGSSRPTDTFTAALNIVRHPGDQVGAVYDAGIAVRPYPSMLTRAPSDWTMSVSVHGGGLDEPTAITIDSSGNIWVASYVGVLSAFSPQGTPQSAAGYGVGVLSQSFGMTIDPNNDVWVAIENKPLHAGNNGSVAKFAGASTSTMGQLLGVFYDDSTAYPSALAADTNGNIFISNYSSSLAEVYSNQGALLRSGLGSGYTSFPLAVAADANHGFWLANGGDGTVTHLAADGTVLAHPQCCDGADAIAVDALGNAWAANYYANSVSEIAAGGTLLAAFQAGGLATPSGLIVDGAQDVWIANGYSGTLSHLAGNRSGVTAGTALSPVGGFGRDARIVEAVAVAVDSAGNLWVADAGSNEIVEFLGLATPTKTPLSPVPSIP